MGASVCPIFDEDSGSIGLWAFNPNIQPTFGALAELMFLARPMENLFSQQPYRRIRNDFVDVGNGVKFEGGVFLMIENEKAPNEELSQKNSDKAYVLINYEGIAILKRVDRADAQVGNPPPVAAPPKDDEGPIESQYRQLARELIEHYGPLKKVTYLSHFPDFEINFEFERETVYSGPRRGVHDIHFLSLGYVGEGPRYARSFLDEAGFSMTTDEIKAIEPGAIIRLSGGQVVVEYQE